MNFARRQAQPKEMRYEQALVQVFVSSLTQFKKECVKYAYK